MASNEELVGGCCVCSDDQGFSNNALVYCDGKGCTVACHTACYGIVSIPDGDWHCRRCEAREFHAPCQLCPTVEGAMKRTLDGQWAHVICALYIPEISFGNDATMEPIILSKIPSARFGQTCSICRKNGRSSIDATKGACCECTVKNCSQVFHVTCAQQAGLLYEDVRKNNCQYLIYCQPHQPKFSKFIRQIPAFHYKSSQRKHSSREKGRSTERDDPVPASHRQSPSETRRKSDDETSQTLPRVGSLTNLTQFMELNRKEESLLTSANPIEPIAANRVVSEQRHELNSTASTDNSTTEQQSSPCSNLLPNTASTAKIKTEENDADSTIIEKSRPVKDTVTRKKRQHSTEGSPRPVGRPPKKPLQSPSKSSTTSAPLKAEQPPSKPAGIPIEFYPRRPLTRPSTPPPPARIFPPLTLEEFLEQEWESTSDFLLQQSMPHDVSSLLSCLYQFKSENASLQQQFDELKHRRDALRVTNANLRRKLSEVLPIKDTITDLQRLPTNSQHIVKISKSPHLESSRKVTRLSSAQTEYFPSGSLPLSSSSSSSLPYEPINPYTMIKNERLPPTPPTNGLSLELLSQILAANGPQLFAPTWNISNFGYASFPGANAISLSDDSIIRAYPAFDQ